MTKHINIDTPANKLDQESEHALLLEEAYQLGLFNTKDGCLVPLIERLQAIINKRVLEIIGEDDSRVRGATQNPNNPMYWTKWTVGRNELREEQRQRLNDKPKTLESISELNKLPEAERKAFYEKVVVDSTRDQFRLVVAEHIYDYCMVHYGVADKEEITKWLTDRLT